MKFRDFQRCIKGLPAFDLNDARKLEPGFHRQQLNDWLSRGYILSLPGGFYMLADTQVDEGYLFMLANRIYQPSYVSLESALAYYLVIPETVLGVTSTSSRKTMHYDSQWSRFVYRSIKPALMFGYRVIHLDKRSRYIIASLEKAVLDYLYLNPSIGSTDDFAGLRWNRQELAGLDDPLFEKYLKIFDNKALGQRAALLREYIHA